MKKIEKIKKNVRIIRGKGNKGAEYEEIFEGRQGGGKSGEI